MPHLVAAIQGGWIWRVVARNGATTVALIAHLAVLFALGYESTSEAVVGQPQAAIAVEIVFAPSDHILMASRRPNAMDRQDPVAAAGPLQPSGTVRELNESEAVIAAFTWRLDILIGQLRRFVLGCSEGDPSLVPA